MATLKTLSGWTLAATLGLMMVTGPAFAKSKEKRDPCKRSCAASNNVGEQCQKSCPNPEGSTSGAFLKCSKACNEKAEKAFKDCVSTCNENKR
ncbi:hypothetical protein [Hyalangium gracile]|uniref:hypothetical protein n=1 Tax=Hyalangium gracile TaxID=394092 RepID=UPI001CCF8862|nr:hypothetical protein [Hyalangium gracile]